MKTTVRMELCRQVADWSHCALGHPDFWGPRGGEGWRYVWKGEKQGCGRGRFTALRIFWRRRAGAHPHQKFLLPPIWCIDPYLFPVG